MSHKKSIKEEIFHPSEQIKNYKNRKVSLLKGILIICCVIAAAVLISNVVFIFLNAFVENYSLSYEQKFLNDALTILGLIVTIWAGLNIYNIIERRDVDEIKQKSEEINNKIAKQKKNLEEFQNDIDEMNLNSKSILLSIEYQFLNELLKGKKDPLSLYFHIKLSNNSGNFYCNKKIISKLLIIEQSFNIVYNLHVSLQKDIHELIDTAKYAQKIIEGIIYNLQNEDTELNKHVLLYLKVRDAQFSFYMGYAYTKFEDIYDCFNTAAKKFLSIEDQEHDILIIKESGHKYYDDFGYNENLRKNSRYIAHFIGESYSRIVLSYTKSQYSEESAYESMKATISKAIYYCQLSIDWLKENELYEVYHRNLGCAYERQDRLCAKKNNLSFVDNNREKIILEYKQAFYDCVNDTESFKESEKKVYQVLLSYLYKYLCYNGVQKDGEKKSIDELLEKKDYLNIFADEISIEYLKDLLEFSEYAISHCVQYSLPIVMNAFAYIFVVVLKKGGCSDVDEICKLSVQECMKKIKTRKCMLEFINHKDDYYFTLDERYKKLRNQVEGL